MSRWGALGLVLLLAAGCATTRAVRRAEASVARGDYDTAVAYYRQALARDPNRIELRIALERTTRTAAAEHIRRARALEADDQISGAMAEYKLAADLDPTSTLAATKYAELERRLSELVDATRPRPRIEALRQQAAQSSPIPHLDPRTPVPQMRYSNAAVRDILRTISDVTGINISYDQGLDQILGRAYSLDIQETPLEDVLNQVLTANGLTFKVVNSKTIFVYQDTAAKRLLFEDQYVQTFFISNADPTEIQTLLQQMIPQNVPVRPTFSLNKGANAITVRATAPVMKVIESLIRTNDRPKPEVMIEAEILEVDRTFIRQLGLDLSQYALGFTFSPELAPPNTASTPDAFPGMPPPFNVNTLSRGTSPADFYLTSPTALIRLLESNSTTRVLAKPSMRGRDGVAMTFTSGDNIPIPTTTFNAAAAGGINNIPTTQVQYTPVGVNLIFTPHVTYQDEIVLDSLTIEKSGLGSNINVGGQSFPTIVTRRAAGSIRLRDGESNLIAGLLRDDDRTTIKSLPGLTGLPVIRSFFGNSDNQVDQTDIVMIITPHIVRSHELTPQDLKPMYVGTGQDFGGGGGVPPLISPDALSESGAPAPAAGGSVSTPAASPAGPAAAPAASRAPAIVPIEPVVSGGIAPPPNGPARLVLTAPTQGPDGALQSGGGPHTIPITIANAPPLSTISVTIVYDPSIVRTPTVTQGSFMMQGGVTPTFTPNVDAASGRVEFAIARPAGQPGASNGGLLAAIAFMAGAPGSTDLTVSAVATSASGQSVPLEVAPVRVTVR